MNFHQASEYVVVILTVFLVYYELWLFKSLVGEDDSLFRNHNRKEFILTLDVLGPSSTLRLDVASSC